MVTLLEAAAGFTIFPANTHKQLLQMHFCLLGWPQQDFIAKSPMRDQFFVQIDGSWKFKCVEDISSMRMKSMDELFHFIKTENEAKKAQDLG